MKRGKKELIISVVFIFGLVYVYLYIFHFDSFCSGFSQIKATEEVNIKKLASCSDSWVCSVVDKKLENNKLETWGCEKKEVYFLQGDYYRLFFK